MRSWPKDTRFNEGDTVRVTGDKRDWGHNVEVDGLVQLRQFDDSDNSWSAWVLDAGGKHLHTTWIGQEDLEPDYEPVTDEEVAKLFGLS